MTPKEEFESQPLSFVLFNAAFCNLAATIDVFTVGDLFDNLRPVTELVKQQQDLELVQHFVFTVLRLIQVLQTASSYDLN